MSTIYLKITFEEKNSRFQNFDFVGLKSITRSVLDSSNSHKYH